MISKENKATVVADNARAAGDTGSPEVQVAILTARINELTSQHRTKFTDQSNLLLAPILTKFKFICPAQIMLWQWNLTCV